MRIKSSGQKAQQTIRSEEQAHISLWMPTSDQQPQWKQMGRERKDAAHTLSRAYRQDNLSTAIHLLPFPG